MLYAYCPTCEPDGPPVADGAPAPSLAWCDAHAPTRPEPGLMTSDEARALARRRRIARMTGDDQ